MINDCQKTMIFHFYSSSIFVSSQQFLRRKMIMVWCQSLKRYSIQFICVFRQLTFPIFVVAVLVVVFLPFFYMWLNMNLYFSSICELVGMQSVYRSTITFRNFFFATIIIFVTFPLQVTTKSTIYLLECWST